VTPSSLIAGDNDNAALGTAAQNLDAKPKDLVVSITVE
jgi:hypothetical protein